MTAPADLDAMERNPYLIQGPAQISFSGGRTSGYLLCKIVEAHGGTLPADILTNFANTGKEVEATYVFIQKVAEHLGVKVNWLEYDPSKTANKVSSLVAFREVDFYSASRNGEPFSEMTRRTGHPPNVAFRTCTSFLKHKPMEGFMRSRFPSYATVAGIRADEPRRVAKMRAREDIDFVLPLAAAGVTVTDVIDFWKSMPFDLELPTINNETVSGNCDLCHLKSTFKLLHLIREEPARADWWIEQEKNGKLFRIDRPNYASLKIIAMQPQLFDAEEAEDAQPCECTD